MALLWCSHTPPLFCCLVAPEILHSDTEALAGWLPAQGVSLLILRRIPKARTVLTNTALLPPKHNSSGAAVRHQRATPQPDARAGVREHSSPLGMMGGMWDVWSQRKKSVGQERAGLALMQLVFKKQCTLRGVREQGNTNWCLQGEAGGSEELEMQDVSRGGTWVCVGKEKRDRERGKL